MAETDQPVSGVGPIPASAVRAALVAENLNTRELSFWKCQIVGILNLSDMEIHRPLTFFGCDFAGSVRARNARLQTLVLAHCSMPGFDVDDSRFNGDLVVVGSRVSGTLSAVSAEVAGHLVLNDVHVVNPAADAIQLNFIQVGKTAKLEDMTVIGATSIGSARIGTQLVLQNSRMNNPVGTALLLERTIVDGDVFLDRADVWGSMEAGGIEVHGDLSMTQTNVWSPFSSAVRLDNAVVGNSFFGDGCEITGSFSADGMDVGGHLTIRGTKIEDQEAFSLDLDSARVRGDLDARGLRVSGVRANGAEVGGDFLLATSEIYGERGILVNDLRVRGGLVLSNATVGGELRGVRTTIDGGVSLQGAELNSTDEYAVMLDGASIGGHVNLSKSKLGRPFRACGALVSGQIIARDVIDTDPTTPLLLMQGSTIRYDILVSGESPVGSIDLTDARMELAFAFECLKELDHSLDLVLNGSSMQMLHITSRIRVRIRAANATIGKLSVRHIDRLELADAAGWVVGGIRAKAVDARQVRKLLEAGHSKERFIQQPWSAMAAALDASGFQEQARSIHRSAAWHSTRQARGVTRLLNTLYGVLVGHGYYPAWVVGWLLVLVILSSLIAANGFALGQFQPIQGETVPFNALLFAFDTSIPAANTGQSASWRATDPILASVLAFLRMFGWILTALLIAGVTGILRKRG